MCFMMFVRILFQVYLSLYLLHDAVSSQEDNSGLLLTKKESSESDAGLILTVLKKKGSESDSGIILTGLKKKGSGKHLTAIVVPPQNLANSTEKNPALDLLNSGKVVISCDTDYDLHHLYYYDYDGHTISLLEDFSTSMDFSSMDESVVQPAASRGQAKIAVDWVNHNIYWTEPGMGRIMLRKGGKSNESTAHYVVMSKLKRPQGIAVDPLAGYIFWTDIESLEIVRANLIGENDKKIVYTRMSRPDSLTLDVAEQIVYWVDKESINSVRYNRSSRRVVFQKSTAYFFDIALFQDVIVATDTNGDYVYFIDKTTGTEVTSKIRSSTEMYYGICTYQKRTLPPPAQQDLCMNYGCQDICVKEPHKPQLQPTCLCREGYRMLGDFKSCQASFYPYERGVVINTGDKLCIVGIQVLSNHRDETPTCFYTAPVNKTISWFDLNMKAREVYFSIEKNIYSAYIDFVTNDARTLTRQNYEIFGLTYDWEEEEIYYALTTSTTSSQPESIWRFHLRSGNSGVSTMITGESPRAIAISPHERKIFWVTGNTSNVRIEYTDLNLRPTPQINIINTTRIIRNITRMYHDVKTEALYLLETELYTNHMIVRMEYDGRFSKFLSSRNDIHDFAVYKDLILTGYMNADGSIMLRTLDLTMPNTESASGKLKGITNLVGMKILDLDVLQPEFPDPCGKTRNFGGCEQICIAAGNTSKCECHMGYSLSLVYNKTCTSEPVLDNFILICDNTHNEIYQLPLDDPSNVRAIKSPILGKPNDVFFDYNRNLIVWTSQRYRQIWGMYLNESTGFVLTDLEDSYPERLAYDPSSHLLYFSASFEFDRNDKNGMIGIVDKNGRSIELHLVTDKPRGLVLHPQKGLLFYTVRGSNPAINRMEMNGDNLITIVSAEILQPNGLTISYADDRLYWADGDLDKIYSCNFDGGQRTMIYGEQGSSMMGLNILDGYLYFTDIEKSKITKVSVTNQSDVSLLGPEHSLGVIQALDIYVKGKTDNIPVHEGCSMNNGGCSHFCLPSRTGHTCACETGYSLLGDQKTCDNVPRCPSTLSNTTINETSSCLLLGGNVCGFTCDEGYRPKAGVTTITCSSELDLDSPDKLLWENLEPCEEIKCTSTIEGGVINETCPLDLDSVCTYTCNARFVPNDNVPNVTCVGNGEWSHGGMVDITICLATDVEVTQTDNRVAVGVGVSVAVVVVSVHQSRLTTISSVLLQNLVTPALIKLELRGFALIPTIFDSIATVVKVTQIDNRVAVGVGVSVAVVVVIVVVVLVLVYLYRVGKWPFKNKQSEAITSFANPRFVEDNVDIEPSGTYKEMK